jgi:hypothetical protein
MSPGNRLVKKIPGPFEIRAGDTVSLKNKPKEKKQ